MLEVDGRGYKKDQGGALTLKEIEIRNLARWHLFTLYTRVQREKVTF